MPGKQAQQEKTAGANHAACGRRWFRAGDGGSIRHKIFKETRIIYQKEAILPLKQGQAIHAVYAGILSFK